MVTGRQTKLLLVEDDQQLASAYRTRLEAEGFAVEHCADGNEALATAKIYQPDLILLDVMMPGISGFDVLDILRNTPETKHIKIIILTALGLPSDRSKALSLGADDYLVKSQAVVADVVRRIRFQLGETSN